MATFNPKHFTDADVLLTIDTERLLQLLTPYANYFRDRGLPLPSPQQASTLDVARLARILESPDEAAPQDLLNAIGYIDEMSTPTGMDALLPKAIKAGMPFDKSQDQSPADIAVQVWLFDRKIVEQEHIWHTWRLPRRMDCYRAASDWFLDLVELTEERIQQAELDVGSWLDENNRSKFCKIAYRITETGIEFSIQRGEPFTRKPTVEDASIRSIHYRPAGKDTVILQSEDHQLMINTPVKRALPIYQRVMGKLLFNNPDYFSDTNIVSLRPLEDSMEDALFIDDMRDIEEVLFVEYCVDLGGDFDATMIYKASNVIEDLKSRQKALKFEGALVSATFRIRYRGSRVSRTLKLYAGNATCYTRDANAPIAEEWMRLRNFIIQTQAKVAGETEAEPKTRVASVVNMRATSNDSALADA